MSRQSWLLLVETTTSIAAAAAAAALTDDSHANPPGSTASVKRWTNIEQDFINWPRHTPAVCRSTTSTAVLRAYHTW